MQDTISYRDAECLYDMNACSMSISNMRILKKGRSFVFALLNPEKIWKDIAILVGKKRKWAYTLRSKYSSRVSVDAHIYLRKLCLFSHTRI